MPEWTLCADLKVYAAPAGRRQTGRPDVTRVGRNGTPACRSRATTSRPAAHRSRRPRRRRLPARPSRPLPPGAPHAADGSPVRQAARDRPDQQHRAPRRRAPRPARSRAGPGRRPTASTQIAVTIDGDPQPRPPHLGQPAAAGRRAPAACRRHAGAGRHRRAGAAGPGGAGPVPSAAAGAGAGQVGQQLVQFAVRLRARRPVAAARRTRAGRAGPRRARPGAGPPRPPGPRRPPASRPARPCRQACHRPPVRRTPPRRSIMTARADAGDRPAGLSADAARTRPARSRSDGR